MDQKVLMTQVWLNNTYSGKTGYIHCDEDGATGNGTIASLISALQIEIGVSPVTGEFGPLTASMCPTLKLGSAGNKVNILQGALWCKGYSSSDLTKTYDGATIIGVNAFKKAAGLPQDGEVDPKTFKGILSTDAVVWGSMGDPRIQEIQRGLNSKYSDYFWKDLNICPVDGAYGRNTCNAMLYAFQKEVGIDEPNGVFGPSTAQGANDHNVALWSSQTKLVVLLQYMLYVNGFDPGEFDGGFGYGVQTAVMDFQEMMALDADGWVGLSTWAALLISKGNTDRAPNAIDTTARINSNRAQYFKGIGIDYVGRYLTGYWPITISEINKILAAGLRYIPIFERSGDDMKGIVNEVTKAPYFTSNQGTSDAQYAIEAADRLGLPRSSVIYFAVDFDVYDFEVESNIIPYFRAVKTKLNQSSDYRVGIYASRSCCSKVAAAGLSEYSYVADMSVGFSGNIGQKMPSNWAFDQYWFDDIGVQSRYMDYDKVIASGRDGGVGSITVSNLPRVLCEDTLESLGFDVSVGWDFNVEYPFYTGVVDGKYKMGITGQFSPMVALGGIPAEQKISFNINDGQFDEVELESAKATYDNLDTTMKMLFGDSDSLQPAVSIANTVSNGKLTLAFYLDSAGNPVFDIQVEQVAETSTGETSIYTEVMYTFNLNQPDPPDTGALRSTVITVLGASVGLLLLILFAASFGTGFGEVLTAILALGAFLTAS